MYGTWKALLEIWGISVVSILLVCLFFFNDVEVILRPIISLTDDIQLVIVEVRFDLRATPYMQYIIIETILIFFVFMKKQICAITS